MFTTCDYAFSRIRSIPIADDIPHYLEEIFESDAPIPDSAPHETSPPITTEPPCEITRKRAVPLPTQLTFYNYNESTRVYALWLLTNQYLPTQGKFGLKPIELLRFKQLNLLGELVTLTGRSGSFITIKTHPDYTRLLRIVTLLGNNLSQRPISGFINPSSNINWWNKKILNTSIAFELSNDIVAYITFQLPEAILSHKRFISMSSECALIIIGKFFENILLKHLHYDEIARVVKGGFGMSWRGLKGRYIYSVAYQKSTNSILKILNRPQSHDV